MSKIYDALLKAQKEQEGQVSSLPEPELQPEAAKPEQAAGQRRPFLLADPEIARREATRKSPVVHKRIISIAVGKFVADPHSLMAEQFRKLRNTISTQNLATSLRSVLVTSCMPGEGKTKVSINLAATIAKGLDDSVILIDADLRRKSLSTLLRLGNSVGLSDILTGRAGIQETLVISENKCLAILPAGSNTSNPAELIASIKMRNLIQQLQQRYSDSYVLIDSAPIVSTSDVNVLSQLVDGVVVVIMADKTRRDVVKRELNTIDSDKILGVVLNCAELETSDYYHTYHKSYS